MARIQNALSLIEEWCEYHGPKISITKTHYNIFTKNKLYNIDDPVIILNGSPLKRQRSVKYLGVIFDQGLTWNDHITDLVKKCSHPIQIMRKVARHDWGGDRASLTLMYISLVRSKMDYACFLYSNAAMGHLEKLDRIQYEAIRLICGIYRPTFLENLEAEANLMPLTFRRKQLELNYFGKVYRLPNHPVKLLYDDYLHYQFYDLRPHSPPIIGRVQNLVNELDIPLREMERIDTVDLYLPIKIIVNYNLLKNKKSCSEIQFQQEYKSLVDSKYPNFIKIFTDGSKTNDGCGCAFFVDVFPPTTVKSRLPDTCGIFTAEMYALLIAIQYIERTNDVNFVIFTDSCSSLQYLRNSKLDHWIKIRIHKISNASVKNIIF